MYKIAARAFEPEDAWVWAQFTKPHVRLTWFINLNLSFTPRFCVWFFSFLESLESVIKILYKIMFPTSWQRCDKPAMTHDIHTKWRLSQWNKCKTSEPGWIIFHFSTFRFNYRLQISSIFSAGVASSRESLCDKWNYLTLCVSCLYMNKAILSENNRECDTFKHTAASQNLGTYSHKRHISKNRTPLFIYG